MWVGKLYFEVGVFTRWPRCCYCNSLRACCKVQGTVWWTDSQPIMFTHIMYYNYTILCNKYLIYIWLYIHTYIQLYNNIYAPFHDVPSFHAGFGFQRFFPRDTFGSKPFADRSRGPGALDRRRTKWWQERMIEWHREYLIWLEWLSRKWWLWHRENDRKISLTLTPMKWPEHDDSFTSCAQRAQRSQRSWASLIPGRALTTDEKIQLIHGWFRMEDPMDDLRGTPPILVNLNIWDCLNFFERETPSHHGLQFSDFQERHESQWPQWCFTRWRKQTSKVWKSVTYRGTLNWWSTTWPWVCLNFCGPPKFISEHHHVPIFRSITALIYMDILYIIYIYSIFRQTHIIPHQHSYEYTMDILWITLQGLLMSGFPAGSGSPSPAPTPWSWAPATLGWLLLRRATVLPVALASSESGLFLWDVWWWFICSILGG